MKSSQIYEDYWKLTLEYTDIHEDKFIGTLQIIVNFIDRSLPFTFSSNLYTKLQEEVNEKYPKNDMGSVRKSINQFVKLGFINYNLQGYHNNTKDFLNAKSSKRRNSIFSKVVYSNAKFNSSVTVNSNAKAINFLLKTLEEQGKLHKKDIIALMTVDISQIQKGYFTEQELIEAKIKAESGGFFERKYNQVSYLWGLLNKLDDLTIKDDYLYFTDDAKIIFGDELYKNSIKSVRDPYLHRIYKNQLKEESAEILGYEKCMVELLSYPVLIASHIKPFVNCSEDEAYDPDNGILLSRNFDILFDLGYITFNTDGSIISSNHLENDVVNYVSQYRLHNNFMNEKRIKYLEFHKQKIFRK